MEWEQLLSDKRFKAEPKYSKKFSDYPMNPFEEDYQKIITSAAFRRLQDKTQVYSLDESDFVRTRLTHSMEVSTIARQLGMMVVNSTKEEYKVKLDPDPVKAEKYKQLIPSLLACAGLIHDLGNPPLGHFGESSMGQWFEDSLYEMKYKDKFIGDCLDEQMKADLKNFEGNAQALRILSKVRYSGGMNLCYATIASLIKYPVDSLSFEKKDPDIKKHKLGYFEAEKAVFDEITEELGMKVNGEACRHPLTFLLEAADDIAYGIADLEDGYRKKLFTLGQLIEYFERNTPSWDEINADEEMEKKYKYWKLELKELLGMYKAKELSEEAILSEWLVEVKKWLMYVVVYKFTTNYKSIMKGKYKKDLFKGSYHEATIGILKGVMKEFVYDSNQLSSMELSMARILPTILETYVRSVRYYDEDYNEDGEYAMKYIDRKAVALFSSNYKEDYRLSKTGNEDYDLYLRILMATDCVAGMTDSYAKRRYLEIMGIN